MRYLLILLLTACGSDDSGNTATSPTRPTENKTEYKPRPNSLEPTPTPAPEVVPPVSPTPVVVASVPTPAPILPQLYFVSVEYNVGERKHHVTYNTPPTPNYNYYYWELSKRSETIQTFDQVKVKRLINSGICTASSSAYYWNCDATKDPANSVVNLCYPTGKCVAPEVVIDLRESAEKYTCNGLCRYEPQMISQ